MKQNEIWLEDFNHNIPFSEYYTTQLEASEENGVIIYLENDEYKIVLDFGVVYSVNITDEGMFLNRSFGPVNGDMAIQKQKRTILYTVKNGALEKYIKSSLGVQMYECYNLVQYGVVSMNYIISIITKEPPLITVFRKS